MYKIPMQRRIRVQTTLKDPQTLRFILDAPVQDDAVARYENANADAPLARALFAIPGVQRIEISGASIYVSSSELDWATMKAPIARAIREVLNTESLPLGKGSDELKNKDTLLLDAVCDLLDREANPAIASHGGNVAVERVEACDVYLRMSGGCQGCAASSATLQQGIETMLRAALPEIRKIIDLTDHKAGSNPFYTDTVGNKSTFNRPLPPGTIDWEDGQIIVDPQYLAQKLGLSPDTLRAGMRNGDIVSKSETGTEEHAGKTRITVRTPVRAWAAEVLADGTAREAPPPRVRPTQVAPEDSLHKKIRGYLKELPEDKIPITYGKLARTLGYWAPGSIAKVTSALEVTMREDAALAAPFIAARVVSRGEDKLPGSGFFELTQVLERGAVAGETNRAFHERLLSEISFALKKN